MRVMHALAVEIAWLLSATYNLGRMQKKFSAPLEAWKTPYFPCSLKKEELLNIKFLIKELIN